MIAREPSIANKVPTRFGEPDLKVLRLLTSDDPARSLKRAVTQWRIGEDPAELFCASAKTFSLIPTTPFVYWIDAEIIEKLLVRPTIEPSVCDIRVGLQTGKDFRFLRLWWEVIPEAIVSVSREDGQSISTVRESYLRACKGQGRWCYYSKTDAASLFVSNLHLLVNWAENGSEIKAYHAGNGHSPSKYVMSESFYFLPGFGYMLRSSRLMPYIVPMGVIPSAGRSQIFPHEGKERWLLTLVASNVASAVARFRGENFSQPKFQNSLVASVPYTEAPDELSSVDQHIDGIVAHARTELAQDETSLLFDGFDRGGGKDIDRIDRSSLLGRENEILLAERFGLSSAELVALEKDMMESVSSPKWLSSTQEVKPNLRAGANIDQFVREISFALGVVFGRWDIRKTKAAGGAPEQLSDVFAPLPQHPPATLVPIVSGSRSNECLPEGYPINVRTSGVGEAEEYSDRGLSEEIREVWKWVFEREAEDFEREACSALNTKSIGDYLNNPSGFFARHLKTYSASQRAAPIYWPLQSGRGSYTLWLYYPTLTDQSLYSAINDCLEPRLVIAADTLKLLRTKLNRSAADERELENQEDLEQELIDMRDTILEIAPAYKPNHDDGVQITAAPLWPLFRHRPWQKVLKDTWEKLEAGEYDWAHLAYSYWPERVHEKCKTDKSLAIAHGLEEMYEEPAA
jgi:hypothetical protein